MGRQRTAVGTTRATPARKATRHVGGLAAIAVLGLTACSGDDASVGSDDGSTADIAAAPAQAGVLPAEDVFEADPVFNIDPSGTFATMPLTTTIDMACAIVFGETEELGLIATDSDMAGGVHRAHALA